MIRLRVIEMYQWFTIHQQYQSETWELIKVLCIVIASHDILLFVSFTGFSKAAFCMHFWWSSATTRQCHTFSLWFSFFFQFLSYPIFSNPVPLFSPLVFIVYGENLWKVVKLTSPLSLCIVLFLLQAQCTRTWSWLLLRTWKLWTWLL